MAHDFEETALAKWHDKNHYPRVALLEALVRFVIADLASQLNQREVRVNPGLARLRDFPQRHPDSADAAGAREKIAKIEP